MCAVNRPLFSGQDCQEGHPKISKEGGQGWLSKEKGQERRKRREVSKRGEKPFTVS